MASGTERLQEGICRKIAARARPPTRVLHGENVSNLGNNAAVSSRSQSIVRETRIVRPRSAHPPPLRLLRSAGLDTYISIYIYTTVSSCMPIAISVYDNVYVRIRSWRICFARLISFDSLVYLYMILLFLSARRAAIFFFNPARKIAKLFQFRYSWTLYIIYIYIQRNRFTGEARPSRKRF